MTNPMLFQVQAPSPVVRATVPLNLAMRWAPNTCPFVVKSPSGQDLITQWERVACHADGNVSVAEFLALNPLNEVGEFQVVQVTPTRDLRSIPLPFAKAWRDNPPMLYLDGQPMPTTWDQGGTQKSGSVCVTQSFTGQHVKGWVTTFDGSGLVDIVVDFNQGEVHSPHLIFSTLELAGATSFDSPIPEPDITASLARITLVPARADGLLHGLPQRCGRPFRLVLHDGTLAQEARSYAAGAGWGCAVKEWRAPHGCFQPQSLPLPDLSHTPARFNESLTYLNYTWSSYHDAIENGTSIGIGTTVGLPPGAQGAKQDWMHPGGAEYGGITSGAERYIYGREGTLVCCTGNYNGVLALIARATLYAQRMPSLILAGGKPALLENYLDATGAHVQNWRMSSANTQFDKQNNIPLDGPFGYYAALQANPLPANMAPEFSNVLRYQEIDWQHFDRWYQLLVSLGYLTNDPWAIWRLRCAAEAWRMCMSSANRLNQELVAVSVAPGHGTDWGRAHGESWTMAAANYALGSDSTRTTWKPWLDAGVDVLLGAQMPSGLYRANWQNKEAQSPPFGDGHTAAHAITKGTEEAQHVCYVQAWMGAVCGDDQKRALAASSILKWAASGLWKYLWDSGGTGSAPINYAAVRPVPRSSAPYGVPPVTSGFDKTEIGAGLGFAAFISPTDQALAGAIARYSLNVASPLTGLLNFSVSGLTSIDDTAPLIAALQQP